MELNLTFLFLFLFVFLGALALWFYLRQSVLRALEQKAQIEAATMVEQAKAEAQRLLKEQILEAKEERQRVIEDAEKLSLEMRKQQTEAERRLVQKEDSLRNREHSLDQRERSLEHREHQMEKRENLLKLSEQKYQEMIREEQRRIEQAARMSTEEARKMLLKALENDVRHGVTSQMRRIEEEMREQCQNQARQILALAMQRSAVEHVTESCVTVIDLPSEEMKGRIIGREGRNIRALEMATGVDLIIDDTPEAVILSGFDPLRREIARMAIEKLIDDGRIHPARIEEVVAKLQAEMEGRLREFGEQTSFELGIHDLHPEILYLLGKLKFRTSYGQNVLQHSKEVAVLSGLIASQIGANMEVARRAGLIHDIGKAIDREMDGTHTELGIQVARKYKESPEVIHAMEAHHFDVDFKSVEAVLVQVADAISASRPGARREILESYVKRLEKLGSIATSFTGVAKAYALQAGREIRVIVESDVVDDEKSYWLAKDLGRRIEAELQYPGQIKVTVIRETRVVEYAR